jgi:hypothetical protein
MITFPPYTSCANTTPTPLLPALPSLIPSLPSLPRERKSTLAAAPRLQPGAVYRVTYKTRAHIKPDFACCLLCEVRRLQGRRNGARGLPAVLDRPMVGDRNSVAAGLLQATSLPFIIAATGIGMELGILSPAVGAAIVVAGLLSVVLFPLAALTILRGGKPAAPDELDSLDHEP